MDIKKPLEGIRVIELANYVAGPTAGRLLTDWGAEVIRVEGFNGDVWRFYGVNCSCVCTEEENPVFDMYNANKKDILLNTKSPEGYEALMKLIGSADVFLTNNRKKALVKSGLDYETLKERFPKLIYAWLTGYGQKGPDANTPGYDGVAFFSRSGLLADIAEPAGYPATAPGCMGDCSTGTFLFGGICAALFARERTGKGDLIEVSLFGGATWAAGALGIFTQSAYGEVYPKKRSEMHPVYTYYRCNDGEWIQLAIMEYERYIGPLCEALEIPNVAKDARFADTQAMLAHRAELIEILEAGFNKFSSAEISERLLAADIVFDRLRHFRELLSDPQALANRYSIEVEYPNGHKSYMAMTPIRSANIGDMPYKRGPLMGEHTDEVLKSVGYSDKEIEKLKEAGAVKQHP